MQLTGRTILIADDEPRLVELMALFLQKEGASVLRATNGQEAFREATLKNPDAILMDLNMPGTNGMEAIRSLRLTMNTKPIIVLTGYCTEETFRTALEAGATVCLAKPPKLADVVRVLASSIPPATPAS